MAAAREDSGKKETIVLCICGPGEGNFDRMQREVISWALRKLWVEKWLMKEVMTLCDNAKTVVKRMGTVKSLRRRWG